MAFDFQKFVAPLGAIAAVIGIYAYLKPTGKGPVQGNLPLPGIVPNYANIPRIVSNVATPSSNAPTGITPSAASGISYSTLMPSNAGNSFLPSPSQTGMVAPAIGPQTAVPGSSPGVSNGSCCGCGPNASGAWGSGISWFQTIQQSAQL